MGDCSLSCQVCLTTFQRMLPLKKHFHSQEHRQKMTQVFKSDVPSGNGSFPSILLINAISKQNHGHPITGLSLLTLCFNKEFESLLYLCHVCGETCPADKILWHLSTGNHCSNYFNYTDPNILSYSWLPSMDMRAILKPQLTQVMKENGPGTLQLLELPEKVMKKLVTGTYSEVMNTLREYNDLSRLLEAVKPKRAIIQTYQRDRNRKHPLLGLQHLVECVCDGAPEMRHYLCTLCKLTLAAHMIIKHVLSFDHIFYYFKEWHPSTLLSKECYTNHKAFACEILEFSRQTEEIHGTANTEIKQVILDPAEYSSVNFACYADALKKLESKTNENKQGSLIVSINPGRKLEYCAQRTEKSSLSYNIVLRCQDCCLIFNTIRLYLNHLSQFKHKTMLMKCFGQAKREDGGEKTALIPYLGLYGCLKESSKKNQPVIGVSLIVTFINTEIKEDCIYVCFACEESFSESVLKKHLGSKNHLINTLLYQNPWRLPFAWADHLNVTELKALAWEEEKERRPNHVITMKVFDIPHMVFWGLLPPTYEKVMTKLQLYHTVIKNAVPHRETYSKLKQNERFPLLGKQFMVMYDVGNDNHTRKASLCLLCERTLSDDEFCAHVFSREHVANFLDRFHPGSLTPDTDAETLLDLAKQAARIHSISNVQVIKTERPIWEPYTYHKAIAILGSAKRRHAKGALEPPIQPKMKLVPRETGKEMAKDNVNSQKNNNIQPATSSITFMKDPQTVTSMKCTDNSDAILKIKPVEIIKHEEEEIKNDILAPWEKKSDKGKELFSETTSGEIKNTWKLMEERTEGPTTTKPNGDCRERSHNTEKDNGKEKLRSSTDGGKAVSVKAKDAYPDENAAKQMGLKSQQLSIKDDFSFSELQTMPNGGLKQGTSEHKETGKPWRDMNEDKVSSDMSHEKPDQLWQYVKQTNREPVIGLTALFECICDQHDTVYLCQCCSLMVLGKNIINHVTGFHHWKMYMVGFQSLPPEPQTEEIRHLAKTFESLNGYGEAQTVELEEDIYNKILKQDFKSALQTIKQPKNESSHVDVEPMDTSMGLQAQQKEQCMTENMQVVEFNADSENKLRLGLQESNSETNPTNVVPDSTRERLKDNFCSSKNKEPLKIATTSKTLASSQSPVGSSVTTMQLTSAKHTTASSTSSSRNTVSSSTMSITAAKIMKKCENTEASKNSDAYVAPHINVKTPSAVPHRPSALSDWFEHKTSHTDPAHSSTTKTKPNENPPKVGVNYLIIVSCEGKQQVYCELCSVRFKNSGHTYSDTHRLNYVKLKYPEWNAEPLELHSKLDNIVAHLAEVEKDVTHRKSQSIQVKHDVYKELGALPGDKAIEKLKLMLKQRALWETSSPTTDAEAVTQGYVVSSTSSFEISSPDGEINLPPIEVSGSSSNHQHKQVITKELHKWTEGSGANGLNQQLHSHLSRNNPEPTPAPSITKPNTQEYSGPGHQSAAQVPGRIPVGTFTTSPSNLSIYLTVKNLETKPIIGMRSVWECQGISKSTFYLCEYCRTMLSSTDICEHILSDDHQLNCMKVDYPQFLYFLDMENVPDELKHNILMSIGGMFSAQERFKKIDAQVVILTPEGYKIVRAAPFSKALEMLQNTKGQKQSALSCSPRTSQQKDKQPEDKHGGNECYQMETSSALEQTDHQCDNEARNEPEKCHLDKTVIVRGIDEAKTKRISEPVDVNSVFSKDDSTEALRIFSVHPDLSQSVPPHQRPVPELQAQQAEVHSESPSFSDNQHKATQTKSVSPSDACLQSKKRPAPPSVETYSTKPQLKGPRQAKYARSSLEPVSQGIPESALEPSVSTLVSPEDKDAGAKDLNLYTYNELINLVKQTKQDKLDTTKTSNSLSEINVEQRLDSKCIEAKTNSPSSKSLEGTFSVAPLHHPASVPNVNSSPGSSMTVNPSASADGILLNCASSADPCDLQHQSSTFDQNVSQLRPGSVHSTATNPSTGQDVQQCNKETTSTGVCPMPITSVITVRPDTIRKRFYEGQNHTEVKRIIKVPHSVPVTTANPSGTVAASGECGQYSQNAYVGNGLSGYASPQAGVGYIPPNNASVHLGSLYHSKGYPAETPYVGQTGNSLATQMPREWVNLEMYQQP